MIKSFKEFLLNENKSHDLLNKYYYDWLDYTDADYIEDDGLPNEYTKAAKKLSSNMDDIGIVFGGAQEDWFEVLSDFKKSGIKMIEIEDEETGDGAIVFKLPKGLERPLPR